MLKDRSTTTLIFVITFLLVFIMAARSPIDSDMWWHLRAGQETWLLKSPYTIDTLSFTRGGERWISHSWLFELLLYTSYHALGYLGICILVAASAAITMSILFLQMDEPPIFRSFIIALGSSVASLIWSPRPQAISLVFLALTLWILHYFKKKNRNFLVYLLPVFVTWGNLYGGYSLGLMVLGLLIAGEILNNLKILKAKPNLNWKQIFILTGFFILCSLVILINPHGIRIWTIPFETVNIKTIHLIDEWTPPDFHNLTQVPFLVFTVLLGISLLFNLRDIDYTDILYSFWFIAMAFYAKKYFGPAAVVLIPILSKNLWAVLKRLQSRLTNKIHNQSIKQTKTLKRSLTITVNISLVLLLSTAAIFKAYTVSYPPLVNSYIEQQYPQAGIEWLKQHQPKGNLLNEYGWGGYLAWALRIYPLFIDARTDLYGDEIINEWLHLINAESGWEDELNQWDINIIFLRPERSLIQAAQEKDWKVVFTDDQSTILVRVTN